MGNFSITNKRSLTRAAVIEAGHGANNKLEIQNKERTEAGLDDVMPKN
jgi:hypothetical protein